MAEMAVLGVFFEHLSSSVNGVGKRDINVRNSSSAIAVSSLISAPSTTRSDNTRHVAAPGVLSV